MPYSCDLVNGRVIEVFEDMIRRLARQQWRSVTFGGTGHPWFGAKLGTLGTSSQGPLPLGLPQMAPAAPSLCHCSTVVGPAQQAYKKERD